MMKKNLILLEDKLLNMIDDNFEGQFKEIFRYNDIKQLIGAHMELNIFIII